MDINTNTKKYNISFIKLIKITEINSLVISGGAMKGYLCLGAIKLLSEYNILNKIKYYYGTSIGGIIITCLNLGWSVEELLKFSIEFPIESLLEFDFNNFIETYGLIPKINNETLFKKIITFKGYNENITFLELYNLTKKELHLITYSLKLNKILDINYLTMPDLQIWQGLCMTSALPILFSPFEYKDDIYIDGGIAESFPLNYIKSENINKFIGISTNSYYTNWDELNQKIINKNIINNLEYLLELIKIIFTRLNNYNSDNYVKLTFDNSIDKSTVININIKQILKQKLINSGYTQIYEQLPNIINNIYKQQIDEYNNIYHNKFKTKYNEI